MSVSYADSLVKNPGILSPYYDAWVGNGVDGSNYGFSTNPADFDCVTPFVATRTIAKVDQVPRCLENINRGVEWYVAAIERHTHSWSGIAPEYNSESLQAHPMSDGQSLIVSGETTIQQPNPVLSLQEILNSPFWGLFTFLMKGLGRYPTTGFINRSLAFPNQTYHRPLVISDTQATIYFMQPQIDGYARNLARAWAITAMRPTSAGPFVPDSDVSKNELVDRQVSMTGVMVDTATTAQKGRNLYASIQYNRPNADIATPPGGTAEDSALANQGLQKEISTDLLDWTVIGAATQ